MLNVFYVNSDSGQEKLIGILLLDVGEMKAKHLFSMKIKEKIEWK